MSLTNFATLSISWNTNHVLSIGWNTHVLDKLCHPVYGLKHTSCSQQTLPPCLWAETHIMSLTSSATLSVSWNIQYIMSLTNFATLSTGWNTQHIMSLTNFATLSIGWNTNYVLSIGWNTIHVLSIGWNTHHVLDKLCRPVYELKHKSCPVYRLKHNSCPVYRLKHTSCPQQTLPPCLRAETHIMLLTNSATLFMGWNTYHVLDKLCHPVYGLKHTSGEHAHTHRHRHTQWGPHRPPGGVKRQSPLWGSGGSAPWNSWFYSNLVVLWSFSWQHLQQIFKKKIINAFNYNINNKWILQSLQPIIYWKTLPAKCRVYLFCECMPLIQISSQKKQQQKTPKEQQNG